MTFDMHVFMGFLLGFMLYVGYYIHKFRVLITHTLVLHNEKTIRLRAQSLDKKFINNSAAFFEKMQDKVVHLWCPVLIATVIAIIVNWIFYLKGHNETVTQTAIVMLVPVCIIFFVTCAKAFKYLHCFSMYMVVSYMSLTLDEIYQRWDHFVDSVDSNNISQEQAMEGKLLIDTYKSSCATLLTYKNATDDPIIHEHVEKIIQPLRSKSDS